MGGSRLVKALIFNYLPDERRLSPFKQARESRHRISCPSWAAHSGRLRPAPRSLRSPDPQRLAAHTPHYVQGLIHHENRKKCCSPEPMGTSAYPVSSPAAKRCRIPHRAVPLVTSPSLDLSRRISIGVSVPHQLSSRNHLGGSLET